MVSSFKYLVIVILLSDDDWMAVIWNQTKAQAVWRKMTRILSREGTNSQVYRFFFKSIVQSVLLFGAETWVVIPYMGRVLRCFQDQVAQRLTGRLPRWRLDRKCV